MNVTELIQAIQGGLIQQDRLIKVDIPSLPDNTMVPRRALIESQLGRDYSVTLDLISTAGDIELKSVIAQPMTLWIQQADKSYLPINGYVHTARRLGADGSFTLYQVSFASWMHFLRFRSDMRYWQDKSVDLIITDVFNQHPQAKAYFQFSLSKPLPSRSYCRQSESDWNFVHRLLEEEGLFGFWRQGKDGKSHTLVVTDDIHSLDEASPNPISFYRAGTGSEADAFTQWAGSRTLQSTTHTTRTFDYKSPSSGGNSKGTTLPTMAGQGSLPAQAEVYEYTGAYTYSRQDRGEQLSKVRLEEWESRAKRFLGVGGVRGIDAGLRFDLTGHPEHDRDPANQREFAAIKVRRHIENNLPLSDREASFPHSLQAELTEAKAAYSGGGVSHDDGSAGFYLVEVEAQRTAIPYRSPIEHEKPEVHLETAIVVGPQGEEVYTDELNRVKVMFVWDRQNPGDAGASCWVRVAQSDTGGGYGGVHMPRVGEEVIVGYVGGDCDRPIVLHRVYNGAVSPQWHSNGILSGHRSKEYGGSGYNQMVMDDATGQNRVQLMSSSAGSLLHLGYLIDQSGNARGAYLGSGFDLRTDAYGAVRASQGLYVTTHPKSASSQPLDVREAQQQLVNAESVVEAMSQASQAHQAESLGDGHDALKAFTDATQNSVQGTQSGGLTAGGGTGSVNAFKTPVMLVASPSGIALSTQESLHVSSDQQTNLVSGQSTFIASGKSLVASVAEKISLFVQNAGMKLFAAKGKVELQAHSDNIEVTAQKTVKVLSATERIEVAAQQEILLTSGGAYIRIKGGNIEIHAPGKIDVKGAQHAFSGPTRMDYPLPQLPTSSHAAAMQYLYHDNEPVQGAKYVATLSDGSTREGTLDSQGKMHLDDVPVGTIQVALGPDARTYARKNASDNPDFKGGSLSDSDIDALIQKHGGAST
ncbi:MULTISPECIES: type VI secretion system Vgr family protein [unclassified Burkholderia]|uniref:type VI secretion system Vgr family protein n=1 Tax=unclassified Burkholderia TaxID=2613784 RepID=UPI001421D086|nr:MULTISPECIES: type VI secretion system Vgr family protein [unclassified Burkholderia]NIE84210.1 type VI secretion system tip protein VgrG [Burkholderia sp. Tr-860]NIF62375.1 type VI secretion system tip protein VgrG [Burkholderia sp. Cy-647]NIF69402.1 type VI secretion system tip protein VgrG [Burkholderia sp. Ap-962]NIF93814.1 type VI secretion system tip protein VgrG [Burkholderia sp. Ax-1720]